MQQDIDEIWKKERVDRHLSAAAVTPYGVSYLDDAMGGILPNELIVIGGRTGRGKTHLATTIALEAARKMKRVAFFALEADENEIHRRLLYGKMFQHYKQSYEGQAHSFKFPRYRDWLLQGFHSDWDSIENVARKDLSIEASSIHVVHKEGVYTAKHFCRDFEALQDETDVFIIDHLHYFDYQERFESDAIKEAIHLIRNASLSLGKPVVLLAQLRKGDRTSARIIPDLDDFHGHSDIAKVATTCLLIAPVPAERVQTQSYVFPTYFHIAKARTAADVVSYVGSMGFDYRSNTYQENYYVEKINFQGDPQPLSDDDNLPGWAKRGRKAMGAIPAPVLVSRKLTGRRDRDD